MYIYKILSDKQSGLRDLRGVPKYRQRLSRTADRNEVVEACRDEKSPFLRKECGRNGSVGLVQKFSFRATCIWRAEVVASGREAVESIKPKVDPPTKLAGLLKCGWLKML